MFSNIYEQQRRNKRTTIAFIYLFILLFFFLGYDFDLHFIGIDPVGIILEDASGFPIGTVTALAIAGFTSLWGFHNGAKVVLCSTQALEIATHEPQYQTLRNVVDEMTKDPYHSHIAVTQGLLQTLNREELQGVIAHEFSHIKNYDIRIMALIAVHVGARVLLSD